MKSPSLIKSFCVPIDYSSNSFCGTKISPSNVAQYNNSVYTNHCYQTFMCTDNTVNILKRSNASEWEQRNNDYDCIRRMCFNGTGKLSLNKCHSFEGDRLVCNTGVCEKYEDLWDENESFKKKRKNC